MTADNAVAATTPTAQPEGPRSQDPHRDPAPARARLRRWRDPIVYVALATVFVVVALTAPHAGEYYGAWSLLPPLALFAFVLITRRVIEGFLWGSVLAVFMTHRLDVLTAWNDGLFAQLTNPDNLWLIITLLSIGALVAILERSGLSRRFGQWVAGLAKTGRAAGVTTLLAALFLSQDAYLSISTTGAAMTDANERVGRSRLFTAYLVRTGAIPGSAFNPLATGSVFVAGLLVINEHVTAGNEVGGYAALIPFMFYPMAALLVGFLAAFGVLPPLGAMRASFTPTGEVRREPESADSAAPQGSAANEPASAAGGAPRAAKPRLINFFGALALLITITLVTGSIQMSLLVTIAVCAFAFVLQRYFTPSSYLDTVIDGMKDMLSLALIMAAAFVFVAAISDMGFTEFVISAVSASVPAALLPALIFLLFGVTEFLVTLNWSLYLLALPVVIPLAVQVGANPNLVIAALISAGLWGATACITSDVGLLNTYTTKTDVFRHWITNLPYQAIAYVLAAVAYLIAGVALA